jgi:hypothetical protein
MEEVIATGKQLFADDGRARAKSFFAEIKQAAASTTSKIEKVKETLKFFSLEGLFQAAQLGQLKREGALGVDFGANPNAQPAFVAAGAIAGNAGLGQLQAGGAVGVAFNANRAAQGRKAEARDFGFNPAAADTAEITTNTGDTVRVLKEIKNKLNVPAP